MRENHIRIGVTHYSKNNLLNKIESWLFDGYLEICIANKNKYLLSMAQNTCGYIPYHQYYAEANGQMYEAPVEIRSVDFPVLVSMLLTPEEERELIRLHGATDRLMTELVEVTAYLRRALNACETETDLFNVMPKQLHHLLGVVSTNGFHAQDVAIEFIRENITINFRLNAIIKKRILSNVILGVNK